MVADGPEQFAEALVSLYQDEALWRHISHNGLQFAGKAWGAETAWEILTSILADLCIWPNRSAHPLSLYSEVLDPREWAATVKNGLLPIGSVTTRKDYFQLLETSAQLKENDQIAIKLLAQVDGEEFTVDGFCVPCNKKVSFLVDMKSGGQQHADGWTPNWRERLECPLCHMNNRQRLVATLVKQELSNRQGKSVYFMEQVTPIFNWANKTFKQHQLIGSEYLGHEYSGGTVINGIRHEDVENLSFSDGQIELIVSNDVFEHVPNPTIAFAECARVLSPSGIMLSTIPFHSEKELTAIRAKIINGNVEHLSPPAFHGNPVSSDGSLVFNDFGWDLLRVIKDSGFSDVAVDVYASLEYGHFGHGQLVFRACK
jgi:SAM-dependent methyltransferase